MIQDPILILAMPRSGSSMTAGVFARHGVWTGTCEAPGKRNTKGSFENKAIKKLLRERYDKRFNRAFVTLGESVKPTPGLRDEIEQVVIADGYGSGAWLWKGSVVYEPAFREFDNPKIVVCRRDPEACLRSALQPPHVHRTRDPGAIRESIRKHNELMDDLVKHRGAFEVDTAAVAQGVYGSVADAIEGCGLFFDKYTTALFVDPQMWHH